MTTYIIYSNRRYRVHSLEHRKYIVCKGVVTYLNQIKGKYKYLQTQKGGENGDKTDDKLMATYINTEYVNAKITDLSTYIKNGVDTLNLDANMKDCVTGMLEGSVIVEATSIISTFNDKMTDFNKQLQGIVTNETITSSEEINEDEVQKRVQEKIDETLIEAIQNEKYLNNVLAEYNGCNVCVEKKETDLKRCVTKEASEKIEASARKATKKYQNVQDTLIAEIAEVENLPHVSELIQLSSSIHTIVFEYLMATAKGQFTGDQSKNIPPILAAMLTDVNKLKNSEIKTDDKLTIVTILYNQLEEVVNKLEGPTQKGGGAPWMNPQPMQNQNPDDKTWKSLVVESLRSILAAVKYIADFCKKNNQPIFGAGILAFIGGAVAIFAAYMGLGIFLICVFLFSYYNFAVENSKAEIKQFREETRQFPENKMPQSGPTQIPSHTLSIASCGSFGCFLRNDALNGLLNGHDNYTVISDTGANVKKSFMDLLSTEGIGAKVFKSNGWWVTAEDVWRRELVEVQTILHVLKENTTYIKCGSAHGLIIEDEQYPFEFSTENGNITTNKIFVILSTVCDSDLQKYAALDNTLNNMLSETDWNTLKTTLIMDITRMHNGNLIHMDIKPENVVKCGGAFKLIDFGLMANLNKPIAGLGGTIDYVSPELKTRLQVDTPYSEYHDKLATVYTDYLNKYNVGYTDNLNYVTDPTDISAILKRNDWFAAFVTLCKTAPFNVKHEGLLAELELLPRNGGKRRTKHTNKKTRTSEHVTIFGRKRHIYTCEHGGRYVKRNGIFVNIGKKCKKC